ncbi:hypothetical protein Q5O14_09115 [Eubacteriaceae bacterium ES2]|nr:hypothetical protein Q5O14_09115 [Eubacteriaceae bacterium ES2]
MGMELFQMDAVKLQPNSSTSNQVGVNELKADSGNRESLTSTTETNSYYRYDTLDLSQGYLNFKTKGDNTTSDNDANLQNSNQAPPEKQELSDEIKNALDQMTSGSQKNDDSTEYNDLSSYTNSELRALFQEGMITAAQYTKEADSRLENSTATETTKVVTTLSQAEKQPSLPQSNQLF